MDLGTEADRVAVSTEFTGVVRLDEGGATVFERAYGMAHRGLGVPNTVDTRFAIASGTKPLTALTVMSLVEDGTLDLSTTARSVLGADLPLIDDAVTVEQLLSHRSGIGDYYDEDTDPALPVSPRELATTEQYVPILDGYPQKFPPGTKFNYNNGAFVVLALIAERASASAMLADFCARCGRCAWGNISGLTASPPGLRDLSPAPDTDPGEDHGR